MHSTKKHHWELVYNGMAKEITGDLMTAIIEGLIPDERFAFFTHTAGGAVKRVADDATAFPHRNAETMVGFIGGWTDPEHDEEVIAGLRGITTRATCFA
jgi:hypothetical protein